MNRDEYMAKWHPGDAPKPQVWLLVVGEYADESVLGVVLGTEEDAQRKAAQLTVDRVLAEEPVDLAVVRVEKAEVL